MAITISTLTQKDWERYRALSIQSAATDPFGSICNEEEVSECPNHVWRNHLNADGTHNALLFALNKDALVGMIIAHRKPNFKVKHVGVIDGLYVVPNSRNHGFGTMLVKEALQFFAEIGGIKIIELEVAVASDIAIKLYEKFGFKIIGRHHKALHIGKEYHDVFSMEMECEAS